MPMFMFMFMSMFMSMFMFMSMSMFMSGIPSLPSIIGGIMASVAFIMSPSCDIINFGPQRSSVASALTLQRKRCAFIYSRDCTAHALSACEEVGGVAVHFHFPSQCTCVYIHVRHSLVVHSPKACVPVCTTTCSVVRPVQYVLPHVQYIVRPVQYKFKNVTSGRYDCDVQQ